MTLHEHIIYSWATKTIDGTGYGVVGTSRGWMPRVVSKDGNLGTLARFLPRNTSILPTLNRGLRSIELLEHGTLGRILVKKTYLGADTAGRAGRYLVHIVKLGDVTWTPAEALSVAQTALLDDWSVDAESSTQLPPLSIEPASTLVDPSVQRHDLRYMLGGILEHFESGRSLVLSCDRESAEASFSDALSMLPVGLTSPLTFSTFSSYPAQSTADITLIDLALSDLDDTDDVLAPEPAEGWRTPSASALELADRLIELGSNGNAPSPEIGSTAELNGWVVVTDALAAPPASLNDQQVISLVTGQASSDWLSAPEARARLTRWAIDNPRSVAVEPNTLPVAARETVLAQIMDSLRLEAASSPSEVSERSRAALAWGAATQLVDDAVAAGLRDSMLAGSLSAAHLQYLGQHYARFLDTLTSHELVEIADNPAFAAAATRHWTPVTAAIACATWTDVAWLRAHQDLAARVASRFPAQSVREFPHGCTPLEWAATVDAVDARVARILTALVSLARVPDGDKLLFASQLESDTSREEVLRGVLVRVATPSRGRRIRAGVGLSLSIVATATLAAFGGSAGSIPALVAAAALLSISVGVVLLVAFSGRVRL